MARPTLSKVIYLQQLGRGTRKAPGKECLVVFDFVDNATRYNQSLSLHRILGNAQYRAGSLVLAPQDLIDTRARSAGRREAPHADPPGGALGSRYEEIDVFNWQEAVAACSRRRTWKSSWPPPRAASGRPSDRGVIVPDHALTLGERTYYYFLRERAEEIREALGLPRVDDASIRELFLDFVARMDMSSSYKPVLLLAILDKVDEHGRASTR